VILDNIAFKNFGVYGGRQEAALAPASNNKPIVLFGGMNGGGKTTLLDGIQLALYGAKARCAGRGKLAYREYLRQMIHRGVDPTDGAAIELRFRRIVDGEPHYYRLTRSWRDTSKGLDEEIEVSRDGEFDALLSQHWDEYIENYIPNGIAHLFFFDAEQIKDLAEGEHAAEILGTAIHTLLGLDLVDRLDTDLLALTRRKRLSAPSAQTNEKVQQAEAELDRIQTALDESKQEQGVIGNEVGRLEKEVARLEERFRQEGGDLFVLRADLEAERVQLEGDIQDIEIGLRDVAAGPSPLLLVSALLETTEKLVRYETESRESAQLLHVLKSRDAKIETLLKRAQVPANAVDAAMTWLKKDRTERGKKIDQPVLPEFRAELASDLRHTQKMVLPEIRANIDQKIETINSLRERLTRCEMELARVPAEDAVAQIQQELTVVRKRLQAKRAEAELHDEKVSLLVRQLAEAKRRLERELGHEVELNEGKEHVSRIFKHSARVRETLAKFRVLIIRKHSERLEQLVLECFNHLLRKRSLVTRLTIDPSTFRLELIGADGNLLPFDRLSAGERQLLATSLLWGLAKASGRPLPTVIDTPLGRLDSSHRRHLLERYFPVASHQVILLSTDKEVDETSLASLKPFIGRSYTLDFDEEGQRTHIKPGYFWNHETAS
jgi:DNA sulfur modification protein DndD